MTELINEKFENDFATRMYAHRLWAQYQRTKDIATYSTSSAAVKKLFADKAWNLREKFYALFK